LKNTGIGRTSLAALFDFSEASRIISRCMSQNKCKILIFALYLLASGVASAGKETTVSSESLIDQARRLQDIWTDGTRPTLMRTQFQVFDAKGEATSGQYDVNWLSPSRWREEIQIANYRRVRVHDAKGYWQQSTLNFQPEIIFQIDALLDYKAALKLDTKEVFGKIKNHDKDAVPHRCTEVKGSAGTDRVLCFDEARGNLLTVEFLAVRNDISRIEYSAFRNVGDKCVPFEARAFRDRKIVATLKIIEIAPISDESPAIFVPPPNSEFWPRCDDMRQVEVLDKVQPEYPSIARLKREQGTVIFYAVIEADGNVSHLAVIQKATPLLDSAAADAIRQWHYKPAACGSTPIRLETSITTFFWLQHQ
jgi:TonB family protein